MRRNPDSDAQNWARLVIGVMAAIIIYLLFKRKSCATLSTSKCPRHPPTPKCPKHHSSALKCPACPKAPPCPNTSCPISPPCPVTCPAYPSPTPCPEATPPPAAPAQVETVATSPTTFGVLGRALDLGYDIPSSPAD